MNHLKEAEKQASSLVADARKSRVDRMKEAKSEAEKSVTQYRLDKEANYQAKLSKHAGDSGSTGEQLETETNRSISKLNEDFNSRNDKVEDMLVDLVMKIQCKVPPARSTI